MYRFKNGEHGLPLFDEAQRRRVGLSLRASGSSSVEFYDEHLEMRASAGLGPDGRAEFRTLDESGKVLFRSDEP